jgi:hypothetical protein
MKLSIAEDIYIKIILLFPILSLFVRLIPSLNRFAFVFLALFQIILMVYKKMSFRTLILLICLFLSYLFATIQTRFPLYNANDYFYFVFMVPYFSYVVDHKASFMKSLDSNIPFMKIVVYVFSFLVFSSLFLPLSWIRLYGSLAFVSLPGTSFRLDPISIFIITIIIYVIKRTGNKLFSLWAFIPTFCIFYGTSRTYLGVCILALLALDYCLFKKRVFYLTLIPLCFIFVTLVANATIGDKIQASLVVGDSYGNLSGVTSTRSYFWLVDLEAFFASSPLRQLFGNGFNFVYDATYRSLGLLLWAHNDFIQILTTFGYFGLLLYIFAVFSLHRSNFPKKKKGNFLLMAILFLVFFVNAFFNMFYTYFCAILSYPILLIAFFPASVPSVGQRKIDCVKLDGNFRRTIGCE